jgi:hypothetical protein
MQQKTETEIRARQKMRQYRLGAREELEDYALIRFWTARATEGDRVYDREFSSAERTSEPNEVKEI